MRIFDGTLDVLQRSLDARLLRHNVLAGNLANADTPGFVAKDVDVKAAMAVGPERAAGDAEGRAGDIPLSVAGTASATGPSPIVEAGSRDAGLDGNGVDVERTLAAVAENAIQYGAAARAVQKKLAILRYAANDGAGA
ncbi:MAG TPA: flagellar basal body rod protein FlgB [Anaeromyxobacteraceae bacterium]|nr:flagellar basal body rod protein FlgB [Anaeromyxobacteraceae bacterium]